VHELSIAQSIVEAIADRFGDAEVVGVRLEIGKLSGVVVESLRFCFDLAAEGTVVHGARLDIDEPGGRASCRACGHGFVTDDPIVLCPSCGSATTEVSAGRELRILSVEIRQHSSLTRRSSS
jgi:hydrogenase nickel incorporation protein HypA/HybF